MKHALAAILISLTLMAGLSAQAYTLSGSISGGVFLGGITYVYAVSTDSLTTTPEFYIGLCLLGNGNYSVLNVSDGDYILFAYQDRDYNLVPSANDYYGFYGDTIPEVLAVSGNMSGLNIEMSQLPFTVIQGTITYDGSASGIMWVQSASDPEFEDIVGYSIVIDTLTNGGYTLFADSGQYYIRSYIDTDFNFQYDPNEPMGYYGYPNLPQAVTISGSSVDEIDFVLHDPAPVTVNITPVQPAIVIPAQGGAFNFVFNIVNNSAAVTSVQVWTEAVLPNGNVYGPILQRSLTIPPGGQLTRTLTQNVPGTAPAGNYTYRAKAGTYPLIVNSEDSFDFIKNAGDNGGYSDNWRLQGWDENPGAAVSGPDNFRLESIYPNPFNAETRVTFYLEQSSQMKVTLYDIQGKALETIADGLFGAGNNSISVDLKDYPSGIYLLKISGAGKSAVIKAALLK